VLLSLSACSVDLTDVTSVLEEVGSQSTESITSTTTTGSTGELSTNKGILEVHFIDIGQGDAIYIKTSAGDDILVDSGDRGKDDVLFDYLSKIGVQEIDSVISTHPDADHLSNLSYVIQKFPVKNVYAPKVQHDTQVFENFLLAVQEKGLTIQSAKAGVEIPLQDTNIKAKFLAPVKEYGKDLNNWSAVLSLEYGETTYLLTGDAEFEAEEDMLASGMLPNEVDVLKVSHHGSEGASSREFLQRIHAKYAILSVGEDNRYDHPRQETLDRLSEVGSVIYRTDKQGSIVVATDGDNIQFQTER